MLDPDLKVAVVGATGVVGCEALRVLEMTKHPGANISALASERSAGSHIPYADRPLTTRRLTDERLLEADAAIFCAGAEVARDYAPAAAAGGVIIVDNSSAFRADPAVPLVIPEVNGEALSESSQTRIIANPNCSTIILLTAIHPIRQAFGVRRIIVSTYQAVSGAGRAGLDDLNSQLAACANSSKSAGSFFPEPIVNNVFTHESDLNLETGRNAEEQKIIDETRRIWRDPSLEIIPTCVRVPVERAHSESITIELKTPATADQCKEALRAAPGVTLCGDDHGDLPTPRKAAHRHDVLVGRVRVHERDGACWLSLWVCGDQLLKGAALNALQILDRVAQAPPEKSREELAA